MILPKNKSINKPIIKIRVINQFSSLIVKYSRYTLKNIGIVKLINKLPRIMYFLTLIKI